LVVLAEVAGDLGDTPAGIGKADHLEAVTSGGGKVLEPSSALEFLSLLSGQCYSVHAQKFT
jgi:hypothetical protein